MQRAPDAAPIDKVTSPSTASAAAALRFRRMTAVGFVPPPSPSPHHWSLAAIVNVPLTPASCIAAQMRLLPVANAPKKVVPDRRPSLIDSREAQ
jgi:hypothetical protein